jgi:hypothetical protein
VPRCRTLLGLALLTTLLGFSFTHAADEAPKGALIVIDSGGKEQKLKAWKFAFGTRHLSWLAAPAAEKSKEKPVGPQALEFREEKSTESPVGILTLIPMSRIRAIDYDNDKQTATVHIATSDKPEEDIKLTATTKYRGENKLVIEAEVDKGDMGIAEIKFQGGTKDKGIRAVRFATPHAGDKAPAGRSARITARDKEKNVHTVTDLQAIYHMSDGSYQLQPYLTFKKTLKVDLAKLKRLKVHPAAAKDGPECELSFKDGEEQTLTLLRDPTFDTKKAIVEGLVGRVPAGYKIFPLHTIAELVLDEKKE